MENKEQKTLVLIGGSGFIGNALGEHFADLGWKIKNFTRKKRPYTLAYPCEQIEWDGKTISPEHLKSCHAVINLAGQGIADKAWSKSYKQKIIESRVESTKALRECLKRLENPPAVVIQASAIGYYGMENRKESCHEDSPPGKDFLSQVSTLWEKEAQGIKDKTRLVIARIGLVMGWEGGAFQKLWDIYTSGVGSVLGDGKQWMNWIHIKDIVGFMAKALKEESIEGAYNLVAPKNLTNQDFHKELSAVTASFSFLKAPSLSLKVIMGGRSALLLTAPKVEPLKTEKHYHFSFPDFKSTLEDLLSERRYKDHFYLKHKQWVPVPLEEVWNFVSNAENLEKITPPWLHFHIDQVEGDPIQEGTRISYKLKLHGLPIKWRSHISTWKPMTEFVDEQEKGPYKVWYHRHLFKRVGEGTLIEDRIDYSLPLFPLSHVALPLVKSDLDQIFDYRKKATTSELCS